MAGADELLIRIRKGTSGVAIPFNRAAESLPRLGSAERIRGGLHLFAKDGRAWRTDLICGRAAKLL